MDAPRIDGGTAAHVFQHAAQVFHVIGAAGTWLGLAAWRTAEMRSAQFTVVLALGTCYAAGAIRVLIPPRVPHNATDLGPGAGMMLSTYLVEPGEALATVVR